MLCEIKCNSCMRSKSPLYIFCDKKMPTFYKFKYLRAASVFKQRRIFKERSNKRLSFPTPPPKRIFKFVVLGNQQFLGKFRNFSAYFQQNFCIGCCLHPDRSSF